MSQPRVSVIVPTKNNEATLQPCLRSIKLQTYKTIELIVVDNFSTDRTVAISEAYTERVFIKGPERCAQRNWGFQKANGKYVVYIDSDMELEKDVIRQCVVCAEADSKIGGVTIHEVSIGEGFWSQCKALERSAYKNDPSIEGVRFFPKHIVLDELGGFDESLVSGEDWELTERVKNAGYKTASIDAIIYHNEGTIDIWKLWQKKLYYGEHMNSFVEVQEKPNGVWYIFERIYFFRPSLWANWREYLKHPLRTVGMVIMLTGELVFGGIGFLRGRFDQSRIKNHVRQT